jgi:hypothetical protein
VEDEKGGWIEFDNITMSGELEGELSFVTDVTIWYNAYFGVLV